MLNNNLKNMLYAVTIISILIFSGTKLYDLSIKNQKQNRKDNFYKEELQRKHFSSLRAKNDKMWEWLQNQIGKIKSQMMRDGYSYAEAEMLDTEAYMEESNRFDRISNIKRKNS